jgi:hypothetical protein
MRATATVDRFQFFERELNDSARLIDLVQSVFPFHLRSPVSIRTRRTAHRSPGDRQAFHAADPRYSATERARSPAVKSRQLIIAAIARSVLAAFLAAPAAHVVEFRRGELNDFVLLALVQDKLLSHFRSSFPC